MPRPVSEVILPPGRGARGEEAVGDVALSTRPRGALADTRHDGRSAFCRHSHAHTARRSDDQRVLEEVDQHLARGRGRRSPSVAPRGRSGRLSGVECSGRQWSPISGDVDRLVGAAMPIDPAPRFRTTAEARGDVRSIGEVDDD